jgi:ankyrin repeat protein
MKRINEIALGLSTIFGINHIDNDNATRIISFCDAESKRELHCVSQRFYKLCSYNNLTNILDHNQDALTQKEKEYALLWATQRSHYNTVKRLLESGTNPNANNRLHLSPLTIARNKNNEKVVPIDENDVPIIKLLKEYNCTINTTFKSPPTFAIAIYTRDIELLQQCLDQKEYDSNYSYDTCDTCSNGKTKQCPFFNILHLAAYIGNANILTILLGQQQLCTLINEHLKHTPYWIAQKNNYIPFMETVAAYSDTDINREDHDNHFPINVAAYDGHTNLVKLLTSHKNYTPDTIDAYNATPLYLAAQRNHVDIAKIFIDDPRINVNYLFKEKYTPLYVASNKNHACMVKLLLTHPNIKEDLTRDVTPLYTACEQGHLDCVKILCLANPDIINTPFNNDLPILIAIKEDHLEIVKHLLSYENIELTYKNGDTIFGTCCAFNHPEAATLFLQHRPEVLNMCDEDTGNSPLHLAAKKGNNAMVKLLLQTNRCNVNILNKNNETPLDQAEDDDIKKLIVQYGGKYGKDVQEQQNAS